MKRFLTCLALSPLVILVAMANTARADQIGFSWQSSFSPNLITPDQPGNAAIILSSQAGDTKSGGGSGDQYAVGLAYESPPYPQSPIAYTDKPFTMVLKLTDAPSGLSQALTFHGTINGYVFNGGSTLASVEAVASFSDGSQSVVIGSDAYQVAMQTGYIPGGTDPLPNLIAKIDVSPYTAPEPSTLLLAGMCLPTLGFLYRRAAPRG